MNQHAEPADHPDGRPTHDDQERPAFPTSTDHSTPDEPTVESARAGTEHAMLGTLAVIAWLLLCLYLSQR
jgi:hypothetical protein